MKMYEFYSARGEFFKASRDKLYYAHVQSKTKTSDLPLNACTRTAICSISVGLRTGTRFKQSAQLIQLLVVA